ncbi:hypothetical protein BH09PSE1_BH09PSE1_26790 [soil metagenome]
MDVFVDTVGDDVGVIKVIASIRLLTAAEGGRTTPLQGGSYRPNHNFFEPDDREMTIGFIELPEGAQIPPGETFETALSFWRWDGLEGQIYPGREWRIQEGWKLVGFGTVLKLLS